VTQLHPFGETPLWAPFTERRPRRPVLDVWNGSGWTQWTWDDWLAAAFRFAGGLRRCGVLPGDRVACVIPNSAPGCAAVLGSWLAGACLVSVPTRARGMSVEHYMAQLRRISEMAEPVVLLVDQRLANTASNEDCARVG
jgi:acyl-CoA synthetase (AMP-forming)/AMP-acid ligase II